MNIPDSIGLVVEVYLNGQWVRDNMRQKLTFLYWDKSTKEPVFESGALFWQEADVRWNGQPWRYINRGNK